MKSLRHFFVETDGGAVSGGDIAGCPDGGFVGGVSDLGTKVQKPTKLIRRALFKRHRKFKKLYNVVEGAQFANTLNTPADWFNRDSVISKLKSNSYRSKTDSNQVGFALEDTEGNITKVLVPTEQAKDFEETVGQYLKQTKDDNNGQTISSVEIAEILYELRKRFTITDATWPTVVEDEEEIPEEDGSEEQPNEKKQPTDKNTDRSTEEDDLFGDNQQTDQQSSDDDLFGDGDFEKTDSSSDEQSADTEQSSKGEQTDDVFGDEQADGEEGTFPDLANAEDGDGEGMEEESGTEDVQSTLKQIVDMLRAEADARKAEATAKATEAKAKAAELAQKAASKKLKQEEEFVDAENFFAQKKEQEKEAKRLHKLAQYRSELAKNKGV
jgi:hypothetical protein